MSTETIPEERTSEGIDPRPVAWFLSQGTTEANDIADILRKTGAEVCIFDAPEQLPKPKLESNYRDGGEQVTWRGEKAPTPFGQKPNVIIGTGFLALHDVMGREAFYCYDGRGLAKLWNIPYVNVRSSLFSVVRAESREQPAPAFRPEGQVTRQIRRTMDRVIETKLAAKTT